MARRRRYQPIARIRRALLLAILLFMGGMAGYYFSDRMGADGTEEEEPGPEDRTEVQEGLKTVARGFDYEVSDGAELAYRVRAERLVADIEDRMELDRVQVELPQDGGGIVAITGLNGAIHLDSKTAILEGNVRARTEDGVELRGEGFEIAREGRTLISTAPVTYSKQDEFHGTAQALTYSIKKERLVLEGDVLVKSLPLDDPEATTLRCDRLTYDRLEKTLRLEGGVRMERAHEFLEANRLSMTFGENESDLRFLRAESGVRGRYVPEPAAGELMSRVDIRGKLLYASFEEGTRHAEQAELRGPKDKAARLIVTDESGRSTSLTAPQMEAQFQEGELVQADAYSPVEVEEHLTVARPFLLRRVCSERAQVTFDALGEIKTLSLDGNVDYQASGVHARGDRVNARGANETVQINGDPAVVVTERGDLEAPRIQYQAEGQVVASDGVRAEMRRNAGYSLMGGESEEPLRITSDTAKWTEAPEKIEFRGDVRAWQGADYLLANLLVGEPELDLLTATGQVKSVLRPQNEDPLLDGSTAGEQIPIEVTAKKLIFEQPTRVITYDGDARAVQGGRTLECDEMDVELDDENEFERLVCTGDLLVEDPAQGKEVRGERAIYVPSQDEVDITGDPVVLTDRDGTELRGGRILYDFESGAARIESRPEEEEAEEALASTEVGDGGAGR